MSTFSLFEAIDDAILGNPEFLHERVAYGIFETIEFVHFGLEAAGEYEPPDFRPPGDVSFQFWEGHEPDKETLPARFSDWITTVGVRRFIEIHTEFLERVIAIATRDNDLAVAPLEVGTGPEGFPPKLDRAHVLLGVNGKSVLGPELKSINRARNCLEHHRGYVTSRDTRGRPHLVIRWRRLSIEGLPPPLHEPDTMRFKSVYERVVHRVQTGEKIKFTSTEFSEIGQTFALHAMLITKLLGGQGLESIMNERREYKFGG